MKRMALFVSVCLLAVAAWAEEDFSRWNRVMTDSATPTALWDMSSSPKGIVSKKLNLPVPVSEFKQAAFEYEIQTNPYDPKRKCHVNSKEYHWADLLLKVNGHVVFCGAAGPHILKGMHRFVFPVEYLKEGENLLQLSWAPLKPEQQGKCIYGYIYVACDAPEDSKGIKSRRKLMEKMPELRRLRLLIR